MNKNIILVKTLLLSTSSINTLKNCKDKKKSAKIKGNLIGQLILYIMLMTYCIANCAGYGYYGLTDSIPVLCATVISLLAFLFTFFKTNGSLFGFRE